MPTIEASTGTDVDLSYLRSRSTPSAPSDAEDISIVDLFAGCGGLTLGVIEGARRIGRAARLALAIDHDPVPLSVLEATLPDADARFSTSDLESGLRGFTERTHPSEHALFDGIDGQKVLLAGPPCQGHSALNNHTRYDDARNDLYLKVARAARLLKPSVVVVENVRGVGQDRRAALERCTAALEELGYEVETKSVDLSAIGVPQKRVRHVLVATQGHRFNWLFPESPRRDVAWAIGDLLDASPTTVIDTPSRVTAVNASRIDYLFDNDAYDLPNEERPKCHRSEHSYVSMYGRLRWDRPAQTITSGYGSMGQGRFVHPRRRRTLTPHEAARLQFLPDFVSFGADISRTQLANMIGNSVPPRLGIVLVQMLVDQQFL
ncbi:MAG: DNA cytosine methyltransferase [Solirubrobacterales bacterium]